MVGLVFEDKVLFCELGDINNCEREFSMISRP
jgi:hypothetical protein